MRARPSRRPLAFVAASLALGLGACLESKDDVTVDRRGAGSMTQTYVVDVAMTKQIKDTLAMFAGSGFGGGSGGAPGTPPPTADELVPDLFSEAATRALAKDVEGFTIASVTDRTEGPKRTVVVKADFASLEAAAKAGRFATATVELKKGEGTAWTFSVEQKGIQAYLDMVKSQTGGSIPGLPEGTDPSMLVGMFEGYFSGLAATRTIAFPGPVGETNGAKGPDGRSVTWKAGFSELMGKGATHSATFSGEGLELKPFRHVMDGGAMYRRLVEAGKPAAAPAPTTPPPAPAPTTPPTGSDAPPTPAPTPPTPGMG